MPEQQTSTPFEAWSRKLSKDAFPQASTAEQAKNEKAQPWKKICKAENVRKSMTGPLIVTRYFDDDLSHNSLGGF